VYFNNTLTVFVLTWSYWTHPGVSVGITLWCKFESPKLLKEMGWNFTHLFDSMTGQSGRSITWILRELWPFLNLKISTLSMQCIILLSSTKKSPASPTDSSFLYVLWTAALVCISCKVQWLFLFSREELNFFWCLMF
jgi:hypothetical protein